MDGIDAGSSCGLHVGRRVVEVEDIARVDAAGRDRVFEAGGIGLDEADAVRRQRDVEHALQSFEARPVQAVRIRQAADATGAAQVGDQFRSTRMEADRPSAKLVDELLDRTGQPPVVDQLAREGLDIDEA